MIQQVDDYLNEIAAFETKDPKALENFRIRFLGSKGVLKDLFAAFKSVPNEQKKAFGEKLNTLKQEAKTKYDALAEAMQNTSGENTSIKHDLSRPGYPIEVGARHPVSIVRNEIIDIFSRIGFTVAEGPEIEDDWHNFTALNFPEEHPARDMQDTFFVESGSEEPLALRTHTSSVQIRVMENNKPPIRMLMPGRVFRNEAISARSLSMFHQIEGLYIDEKVSMADLKQTILYFAQEFFGKTKIRMRPSYFPFTEPSAEVDVYWGLESEADYRMTKGTGWLEIMGCGMVDPAVLSNCGIDPEKYSGFAFGMGIERVAAQRYGIDDIRLFLENDLRFLKQFK
jgi:phenylalanyl-tRNA synthetase alpha chain